MALKIARSSHVPETAGWTVACTDFVMPGANTLIRMPPKVEFQYIFSIRCPFSIWVLGVAAPPSLHATVLMREVLVACPKECCNYIHLLATVL